MNILSSLIFHILPYLTIIVFLAGMIYRFYVWAKLPSPIITLFPRPNNGLFWGVIKETFLFPGLFKSDRFFWAGAWIFHLMLAFIALGHFRVFTDFPWLWNALGMDKAEVDQMSALSGGIAGLVIMAVVLFLIFRRIGIQRVREISAFPDYLIMLLILAIIITGNAMRFATHFDLELTRNYFTALFTIRAAEIPQNSLFLLHFLFAQLLIILIPFSKILHLGGVFFSQTILKRS